MSSTNTTNATIDGIAWEFRDVNVKDASSLAFTIVSSVIYFATPLVDLIWSSIWSFSVFVVDYIFVNTYLTVLALLWAVTKLPKVSGLLLAGMCIVLAWALLLLTSFMSIAEFIRVTLCSFVTSCLVHYLIELLPTRFYRMCYPIKIAVIRFLPSIPAFIQRQIGKDVPSSCREASESDAEKSTTVARRLRSTVTKDSKAESTARRKHCNWSSDAEDDSNPYADFNRSTNLRTVSPCGRNLRSAGNCKDTSFGSIKALANSTSPCIQLPQISRGSETKLQHCAKPDSKRQHDANAPDGETSSDEEDVYEIEFLDRQRLNKQTHKLEYYVKWKGYKYSEGEWKSVEDLISEGCEESIRKYHD